jgi:SdpI/YfhL protein family
MNAGQETSMGILLALYIVGGLVLAGLSIPLILHRIPPNGLYGFRLPVTMSNPDLWYKVNEYSGWRFLVAGLGTVIGAVILYFITGLSVDTYAMSCLGVFLAFFLWGMFTSYLYLKSIRE